MGRMGPARGQLWGWGGWDQLEDSSGGGADGGQLDGGADHGGAGGTLALSDLTLSFTETAQLPVQRCLRSQQTHCEVDTNHIQLYCW